MIVNVPNFVCSVCERDVDRRWWNLRDRKRNLPPICSYCEQYYAARIGPPKRGSAMDRRNAMRIAALAEAILGAAGIKQWSATHGRA